MECLNVESVSVPNDHVYTVKTINQNKKNKT